MTFATALSGLTAAATDLAVTGNNIANASTTGFKESRTEFADVYAVAYSGITSNTPGSGVRVATVAQQFNQGTVDYTNNSLDLSISGKGFFIMSDNGAPVYTRAGSFHADRDGYVVNSQNQKLQIFPTQANDSSVFNTGIVQDLQVTASIGAPNATTLLEGSFNLDSRKTPITVTGALDNASTIFNPNDPASYQNSSSLVVYDSQGGSHTATTYFRKVDTVGQTLPNTWQAFMYVDGVEVPPLAQPAGTPAVMTFTTNGSLNTVSPAGTTTSRIAYSSFTPTVGVAPISMEIDTVGTTQYGTPYGVNKLSQNGFTTGQLTSVDIDKQGVVFARFTNGESRPLGKVAMASFQNPQGLKKLGDTSWGESFAAGDVLTGEAGSTNFGLIQAGALESSNVDVASQLVKLITAQRNFQANAQVITTANTITQTIINIR